MTGGWIKFEKDLREDPRMLHMIDGYVTQVRCTPRYAVTLLLGCLAQLWMYADSYIREDDTLDLGANKVNELVGVEGFVELMPHDWLEIIDAKRVKLPGFHEHNGKDAKKRALTAKRVQNHRIRNVTQLRSESDSSSNAAALPDKTRLDKTRGRGGAQARPGNSRPRKRCPDEFQVTAELVAWAKREAPDVDIERETRKFRDWEFQKPRTDWPAAWRIWMGKAQDEYASRPNGAGRGIGPSAASIEATSLSKLRDRRGAIGIPDFREPKPGESADAYRQAQEQACVERDNRARPAIPGVAQLVAQKAMRA